MPGLGVRYPSQLYSHREEICGTESRLVSRFYLPLVAPSMSGLGLVVDELHTKIVT